MTEPRHLSVGEVGLLYAPGLVRRVTFRGTEVIRMINAPVRDADWGTAPADLHEARLEETAGGLSIRERFSVFDGALEGELVFTVAGEGRLDARLDLTAVRDVTTNRAGFTILHPIAGVAGTAMTLRHPDGSEEEGLFPETISAGQPAFEIAGIAHAVEGTCVEIAFEGEVFEMEDQRNWSDASFKTYCRPLSRPMPYVIRAGETVRQRIVARFSARDDASTRAGVAPESGRVSMPRICLALEPDWNHPVPAGAGALLRFHGAGAWSDDALRQLVKSHPQIDAEIVVPDGGDARTTLEDVADALARAGLRAAHVMALPEAYLRSHQPSGPWPQGITPAQCARVARAVFPEARVGVGMLTHFTEFNRHPPEQGIGDYATFGNSAIVHAADDLSVWETLEAIPHVLASARRLSRALPLRLGLFSIGMRSNPYGRGLAPNPGRIRLPMAGEDPRQDEVFAAAYAVAVCALAAEAGVEAIALAAPRGRFGLIRDDGTRRPIAEAIDALLALGGEATVTRSGDLIGMFSANGTVEARITGDGALHIEGREDTHAR